MDRKDRHCFEFEGYSIDRAERLLRRDRDVVQLPPKAIDLLLVLLESHGRVVSKEDLMAAVWSDSVVEEANLSHNIFLLRKALGEKNGKFIETVPKRGYRFVAEVGNSVSDGYSVIVGQQTVTRISLEEEIETASEGPSSAITTQTIPIRSGTRAKWISIGSLAALLLAGAGAVGYRFLKADGIDEARPGMEFSRITNSGKVACSSMSPDGRLIAYAQNYTSGEGMVFARQIETNREIKLIEPGPMVFGETGFSPDSQFIYYVAIDDTHPKGALYRVPVFGGIPKLVVENSGTRFTISSDGKQAVLLRKDAEKTAESIVIVDLDGKGEQVLLTRPVREMDITGSPAWSPDKRKIFFLADAERTPVKPYLDAKLHELDVETGSVTKLSDEVWGEAGKTFWLADGRGIIFVGSRPRIGSQLYYFDVATRTVRQLTNGLQIFGNYGLGMSADAAVLVADLYEETTQLWSIDSDGDLNTSRQLTSGESDGRYGLAGLPDGRVGYVSRTGRDLDIWTINSDGSDAKPITADNVAEHDITFSPNGERLVFAADRGDGRHIFRTNRNGSELKQLTFGDASESAPDFSPDGHWIVYSAWRDNRSTLRRVSIDGGEPIQLTDYDSTAPTFSPDGSMIAAILPSDSQARPATITVISAIDGSFLKNFRLAQFDYYYKPPRWAPDGKSLVFWRDEKHIGNLWSQPFDGGEPRQLTRFTSDLIYNYAFSRDGRTIFLSRGLMHVNTVMIKNLLDGIETK